MAFFEIRQYKVLPGKMDGWVEVMEKEIIPFQVSQGMVICGSYRHETDESVYFWIRRFESEAQRVAPPAQHVHAPARDRRRARRADADDPAVPHGDQGVAGYAAFAVDHLPCANDRAGAGRRLCTDRREQGNDERDDREDALHVCPTEPRPDAYLFTISAARYSSSADCSAMFFSRSG